MENLKKVVSSAITEKVRKCQKCEFYSNGKAYPFFGKHAKFLMIGEAPHVEEIKQGFPFVGDSGETMWKSINSLIYLDREDFVILNSVMCKPTVPLGKTVGKPKKENIDICLIKSTNALPYLNAVFGIKHILSLGNYAKYIFTGNNTGIESKSGISENIIYLDKEFTITYCIHPASILHNPSNKTKFEQSLISFKEVITFGI